MIVGAMIVGAMIVGTMIVRAMIVGTMVVGAMIVGAMRRPLLEVQVVLNSQRFPTSYDNLLRFYVFKFVNPYPALTVHK